VNSFSNVKVAKCTWHKFFGFFSLSAFITETSSRVVAYSHLLIYKLLCICWEEKIRLAKYSTVFWGLYQFRRDCSHSVPQSHVSCVLQMKPFVYIQIVNCTHQDTYIMLSYCLCMLCVLFVCVRKKKCGDLNTSVDIPLPAALPWFLCGKAARAWHGSDWSRISRHMRSTLQWI
jgi:hypothetical protein